MYTQNNSCCILKFKKHIVNNFLSKLGTCRYISVQQPKKHHSMHESLKRSCQCKDTVGVTVSLIT